MSLTLKERDVREFLGRHRARLQTTERPLRRSREDMLVEFINDHYPRFNEIRVKLARARVLLLQSARAASDLKPRRGEFQRDVDDLTTQRYQAIIDATSSDDFETFLVEQAEAFDRDVDAFDISMQRIDAIERILARKDIPDIVVENDELLTVINAVDEHAEAAPKIGDVMLRSPEPYHSMPLFQSRQPKAVGLPISVLGHMVGLTVTPESSDGAKAVKMGAVSSKGRLFMPLSDDGWPQDGCDWDGLTDFLPLAARRIVIPILPDLIPSSSWGSSLANMLVASNWSRLRHDALDVLARTCGICGSGVDLECHEMWEYAEPVDDRFYGLQRLDRLAPLCSSCHTMHHLGRERVRGTSGASYDRLRLVNRWSHDELSAGLRFMDDRFKRRSRRLWALDLSSLVGTRLSLKASWKLQRDGWIEHKGADGIHATRLLGVLWNQDDRSDVFDPVPAVHFVGWDDEIDPSELQDDEEEASSSSGSSSGGFGDGGGLEENEEEAEEAEKTLDTGISSQPAARTFTFAEPVMGR